MARSSLELDPVQAGAAARVWTTCSVCGHDDCWRLRMQRMMQRACVVVRKRKQKRSAKKGPRR